jgi:hypothetical protein
MHCAPMPLQSPAIDGLYVTWQQSVTTHGDGRHQHKANNPPSTYMGLHPTAALKQQSTASQRHLGETTTALPPAPAAVQHHRVPLQPPALDAQATGARWGLPRLKVALCMRLRAEARGPALRGMRRLRGAAASGSSARGSGATHRSSAGGMSASIGCPCCCCWGVLLEGCGLAEPSAPAPWLLQASRRMRLWPARPPCCCVSSSAASEGPGVGDELRVVPLLAAKRSSSRLRTLRARPLL